MTVVNSKTVRTFAAVIIPADVRKALWSLADNSRIMETNVRWVNEENLHITLKFLGDTPVAQLASVSDVLKLAARKHKPFSVVIDGFGVFPNAKMAKVVWAGVSDGSRELAALSNDCENALDGIGFERENRFKAHITLGRLRQPGPFDLMTFDRDQLQKDRLQFEVSEFLLMKSVLGPGGSKYEPLDVFPFEGF